jgi:SAM-dependent methyltransferase
VRTRCGCSYSVGAHSFFDAAYRGEPPPWDIGRPQPAFATLAESGAIVGRVLDAGCGTGEHALLAARLGLQATGIDAAPSAIRLAEEKARQRGLEARFLVGDALDLASLGTTFDTVLDCGLFHGFTDAERVAFVASLAGALAPGGRYLLLAFSDRQPGSVGPRRIREAEIREAFADGWVIEAIEPSSIETTVPGRAAEAWLARIRRT